MPEIKLTTTIAANPRKVFAALTQKVHLEAWLTESTIDPKVGGQVTLHFRDKAEHATFTIERMTPGALVQWRCVDSRIAGGPDWNGTTVTFELMFVGNWATEIALTHAGWAAEGASFDTSRQGWEHLIKTSLKEYLETGKGRPGQPASAPGAGGTP
jgi:uncharacterized protein YndB with AHSA1/START domain